MSAAGKPSIAVVVTARPSFARIRTVLDTLVTIPDIDTRVIFAGSSLLHHYGQVDRDCPYPVWKRVYSVVDGQTPETSATETGLLTIQLSSIFAQDRPNMVVTIADRHETLATAIAASYQNITLAHLQGGEKTGNIDNKVRDAVSNLADLHFPATERAEQRLYTMGVRGSILWYGCPSIDLAVRAEPNPSYSDTILVLQHPVTNEVEYGRTQIEATLQALSFYQHRNITWFWPGQDAGSESIAKRLREFGNRPHNVKFKRHLPSPEFLRALSSASIIVGNSSAGIREASFLGTPAVDIGTRQQGRECGPNVIHVGHDALEIADAIRKQLDHGPYERSDLYGTGNAGVRIAQALANYVRADAPVGRSSGP